MTKKTVQTNKVPRTMDAFKKAYPKVTCEDTIILSPEACKSARRIVKLHAMISLLTKQEDQHKLIIAMEIKGHACGDAGLYNVYMPKVDSDKFDMEAFAEEEPEAHEELMEKYTRIHSTRKFDLRVKAGA